MIGEEMMKIWSRSGRRLALVFVSAACLAAQPQGVPAPWQGTVMEVIDGDSIRVVVGDIRHTVRLIGIDAPEFGRGGEGREPFAEEAARYARGALLHREVRLEFDEANAGTWHRDAYDRLLGYVFVGETLFNAEIVKSGWARVYTRFPCARTGEFLRLEEEARAGRKGIWAGGGTGEE